jgi:hypothetical protein
MNIFFKKSIFVSNSLQAVPFGQIVLLVLSHIFKEKLFLFAKKQL